jgi:uncharacterized protein
MLGPEALSPEGAIVPGKFVLQKGSTGKFRFNLLSPSGKVIATSEVYETRRAAMAGIESVRKNAPAAAVEDRSARARVGAASVRRTPGKPMKSSRASRAAVGGRAPA